MAESFVDLEDTIAEDLRIDEWPQTQVLRDILEWLDKHRDQAPGRTMTVGEMDHKCTTYGSAYETGFKQAGGVIVPDPEPTNAEKWETFILKEIRSNSQWDASTIATAIDKAGVKAPGGDDE